VGGRDSGEVSLSPPICSAHGPVLALSRVPAEVQSSIYHIINNKRATNQTKPNQTFLPLPLPLPLLHASSDSCAYPYLSSSPLLRTPPIDLPLPGMMQSPDSLELPKTEPEPAPLPPSIIGSTNTDPPGTKHEDYPPPLLPTEPMNEDTLPPQPADSIAMQTEEPSEQAPLGQQVRYHRAIAGHESGSQRLGSRTT